MYHESRVSVRMAHEWRALGRQMKVFQAPTPLVNDDLFSYIYATILGRIKEGERGSGSVAMTHVLH